MAIRLEDDEWDTDSPVDTGSKSVYNRLVNSVRLYNIPALNLLIIGVLSVFLFKLTTKYSNLYVKSSLITIIVTNLVLYGISETLAQSVLCYNARQPAISFKMYEPSIPDLRRVTAVHSDPDEEEQLDRFIEYLEQDSDTYTVPGANDPLPVYVPLTFFNFGRLAGFMCWGFVMSFAQSWWYKFLQIYSKDPKFIEVLRKVLTDQVCYSPISLFCFFTYGTMVLENGTWEDTKKKISAIYLKTLMINYSVWFPVQFINFLLVPRSLQVPFSSSISVLWNCFLSMKNSNG